MAFMVKKKIKGREYYYLNENKRVGGKVKTKTLAYLGKNRADAEKKMKDFLKNRERKKEEKIVEKKKRVLIEEIKADKKLEEINRIASGRAFFFQTANIYGGKAGFYTYGHLGKFLRTNWENLWRESILSLNDNFYEIQSNNILPEEVFKASGHIENFNDPMLDCKKCKSRFKADQFLEDNGVEEAESLTIQEMNNLIAGGKLKCQKCGSADFSEARQFNMMFDVNVGFSGEKSYLSPETAQGAYVAFLEEFKATRGKLPLGLAIIDKAYRNEISPRQMFFRLREFSQAELQIFFDPEKINEHENWKSIKRKKLRIKFSGEKEIKEVSCEELNGRFNLPKWYIYHASKVQGFYIGSLKIPKKKFRFRELGEQERAFYNKIHFDVEVHLDTLGGFKEVGGIHYRTDHDLSGHQKISGKKLEINIDGKKFIPHVLELSFGIDRNVWMLMDLFCKKGKEGTMFTFPPKLAPIKAAVFPIVKKPGFENLAKKIFSELNGHFSIIYDGSGSIGKRYARNDEIGTPYCITIDGDSLKKDDATIRNRDTTEQKRVKISKLGNILTDLLNDKKSFENLR